MNIYWPLEVDFPVEYVARSLQRGQYVSATWRSCIWALVTVPVLLVEKSWQEATYKCMQSSVKESTSCYNTLINKAWETFYNPFFCVGMAGFVIRSTTKFLCGICTMDFSHNIACEEHVLGHFVMRSATGFLCVICAQGFNSHDVCGYHVLKQHSDILDKWNQSCYQEHQVYLPAQGIKILAEI